MKGVLRELLATMEKLKTKISDVARNTDDSMLRNVFKIMAGSLYLLVRLKACHFEHLFSR